MKIKNKRHLESVVEHIQNVQRICLKLATRLIEDGHNEEELALRLIANSMIHDNSKFHNPEFTYLRDKNYGTLDTQGKLYYYIQERFD